MEGFKIFLCAMGRIFISIIFISSSVHKVLEWKETERGVMTTLSDWGQKTSENEALQTFFVYLASYVDLLVIGGVTLELIGGLMVLLGFKPKIGAFLLLLFMIPTTLLFHAFWFYEDETQKIQMIMFLKNIAIMGGLLYVIAFGLGKMEKKDGKKPKLTQDK